MQEGDLSLEWLSIFVEDCFSSSGNCLPPAPPPPPPPPPTATTELLPTASKHPEKTQKKYPTSTTPSNGTSSLHKFVIPPGKARSKRKRRGTSSSVTKIKATPLKSIWSHYNHHPLLVDQNSSDPPLLQQAYWLADSELINLPKKEEEEEEERGGGGGEEEEEEVVVGSLEGGNLGGQGARRCSHCQSQRTPQWRAGPKGPKTLCNACGVRYKSGRLLPEYRPAKSPTFVSYKHSNSHRKVLEMRNSSNHDSNGSLSLSPSFSSSLATVPPPSHHHHHRHHHQSTHL